jgi:uncharacterized delta-60 repeat protein
MLRWIGLAAGAIAACCLSMPSAASAAKPRIDPRLDVSYGSGGLVTASIVPGAANIATSFVTLPNGGLLVGGYAKTESKSAFVARLTPGGAVDSGFANGPVGTSAIEPVPELADEWTQTDVRLALTGDGHVLVLGRELLRLTFDGAPDPAFGAGGRGALTDGFTARALAVQPDGFIVLAGTRPTPDGTQAVVTRLTPTGALDPGFGQSGVVTLPTLSGTLTETARTRVGLGGVALDRSGRIVIAGIASSRTIMPHGFLARLLPSGALDPSFGQAGQTPRAQTGLAPASIRIDPAGRIVSAGELLERYWSSPQLGVYGEDGALLNPSMFGCYPCTRRPDSLSPLPGGGFVISGVGSLQIANWDPPATEPLLTLTPVGMRDNVSRRYSDPMSVPDLVPRGTEPTAVTTTTRDGRILASVSGDAELVVGRLLGVTSPVQITSRRLQRARRVRPRLRCLTKDGCHGTLRISTRTRGHLIVLGRGRFSATAGHSSRATVTLSRSARARLRRHRTTRATITATPTAGSAATATVTIAR